MRWFIVHLFNKEINHIWLLPSSGTLLWYLIWCSFRIPPVHRQIELHCVKSVCIWSYSGMHFSRIFPHLDWIRKDTEYLSVFSQNAGKCGKNADQNNSEYGYFLRSDVGNFPSKSERGQDTTCVLISYQKIVIRHPYLESNYFAKQTVNTRAQNIQFKNMNTTLDFFAIFYHIMT